VSFTGPPVYAAFFSLVGVVTALADRSPREDSQHDHNRSPVQATNVASVTTAAFRAQIIPHGFSQRWGRGARGGPNRSFTWPKA